MTEEKTPYRLVKLLQNRRQIMLLNAAKVLKTCQNMISTVNHLKLSENDFRLKMSVFLTFFYLMTEKRTP